ncbi:synaptonemal complex central element protein 2 [Gadus macrocephalus]|uniref:synaptonemal complex central element protein 2 n=1 Tax=Gadus macrocephalus TaxID=80720 RepID=UPI0028CBB174|nr:synaptonemal complex central element protein 2 [Gadus macrocephalus]
MAEFFPGKSAPIYQSTPKPGSSTSRPGSDLLVPQPAENLSIQHGTGDHVMTSEGSGVILDISSIPEQEPSPSRKKPRLGAPQTASSSSSSSSFCSLPWSDVDELGRRAQELVERINQSRDRDQEIICSFQDQLLSKVGDVCQQVKEQLFSSYEEQGQGLEQQLQELSRVLERSSSLSTELQDVSTTLSVINTGLLHSPRALMEPRTSSRDHPDQPSPLDTTDPLYAEPGP